MLSREHHEVNAVEQSAVIHSSAIGGRTMRRCSAQIAMLALAGFVLAGTNASAGTYDLVLDRHAVNITGHSSQALLINGQLPGPVLRFKEGENVTVNVTNRLDENASIHWHGLIVPPEMDGVPGVSPGYGNGIEPGATFIYRFKVKQSGTYWYHSHSSGEQEQLGIYGPLIIEPPTRSVPLRSRLHHHVV
jgi:FtsP/CotA-like multicopper oxidase with cupredoxin domain